MKITDKMMVLIISGSQVALGAIMLILVTVSIAAHAIAGHLGFIGWLVAALMWTIIYRLFRLSVQDYKKDKATDPAVFEQDFEDYEED